MTQMQIPAADTLINVQPLNLPTIRPDGRTLPKHFVVMGLSLLPSQKGFLPPATVIV